MMRTVDSVLSIDVSFQMPFGLRRGAGEGKRLLRNSLIGRRLSLVPLPSWRQTLEPSDEKWADQVFRMPLARSRWRRERISIWTSEQRQELGDEVIVANVRELRAISHVHRKSDQVEADGMDEEQATTKALETDRRERRQKASRRLRWGLICQVA